MDFVVCANCGKTMPKQVSGIELLDSMQPEMVWCSQFCYDEWNEKQMNQEEIINLAIATATKPLQEQIKQIQLKNQELRRALGLAWAFMKESPEFKEYDTRGEDRKIIKRLTSKTYGL
jgi:hypothetical protein